MCKKIVSRFVSRRTYTFADANINETRQSEEEKNWKATVKRLKLTGAESCRNDKTHADSLISFTRPVFGCGIFLSRNVFTAAVAANLQCIFLRKKSRLQDSIYSLEETVAPRRATRKTHHLAPE